MTIETISQKIEALGKIVDAHPEIKNDFTILAGDHSLTSAEATQKEYAKKIDHERDLQIGIIGRVKAGKSSLLNALLFAGEDILPKAATPMTAALTILSYGAELKAIVEFFSQEDYDELEQKHRQYQEKFKEFEAREFEKLNKQAEGKNVDKSNFATRAKSLAQRELEKNVTLSGAYQQFEDIKKSGKSLPKSERIINPSSLTKLANELGDYIGADGTYTPFTKSVEIQFPETRLQGLKIVDTPGFNDPVASREERARSLLKVCDVVLILSPAGQFMSQNDTELLDRITSKDGIRELFVIPSQIDTQLFGSELKQFGGLEKILAQLRSDLGGQLSKVLSDLKNNVTGIGTVFDQLIREKDRILHSSGICIAMEKTWANKNNWDAGRQTVWQNLVEEFPEAFADDNKELSCKNLKLLGNVENIDARISTVQVRKKEILAKNEIAFYDSKEKSINAVRLGLIERIDEQMKVIENTGVGDLEKQCSEIKKIASKLETGLTETYEDCINAGLERIKDKTKNYIDEAFGDATSGMKGAESSEERKTYRSYTTGILFWKKYHTVEDGSYTVKKISKSRVRDEIQDFAYSLETELTDLFESQIKTLKRDLRSKLLTQWNTIAESDDDGQERKLIKAIDILVSNISIPTLKFDANLDGNKQLVGKGSGNTLEGSDAEEFIEAANSHIRELRRTISETTREQVTNIKKKLANYSIASELINEYQNQLEELKNNIENKKMVLEKLKKLRAEVEAV